MSKHSKDSFSVFPSGSDSGGAGLRRFVDRCAYEAIVNGDEDAAEALAECADADFGAFAQALRGDPDAQVRIVDAFQAVGDTHYAAVFRVLAQGDDVMLKGLRSGREEPEDVSLLAEQQALVKHMRDRIAERLSSEGRGSDANR